MTTMFSPRVRRAIPLALAAGFLFALAAAPAGASPPSRKMERQMVIFERIVDEMLIESPNFLVKGRDNTRGHYDDGDGAVFVFKTSLVGAGWGSDHDWWHFWDDDRDRRRYRDDDDGRDWMDREIARQKRRYERGKEEIVDTIVDFGDMLTTLSDMETLTIQARLRSADYFDEADLRRLTVTIRMSDVRAYADGRIDEDELRARVDMDES